MKYEYLIVIGALGLLYLILDKLTSIAASLKEIDSCAKHLSMQVGVANERLFDLKMSLGDCKSNLEKIEDVANDYQRLVLHEIPSRPQSDW